MKRNLFKPLFIVVASAAVMAACSDTGNTDGDYTIPSSFGFYNPEYAGVEMKEENYELTVLRSGEAESAAYLSISDAVLAEYNSYNKTAYEHLSPDLYNISATTLNFAAAEKRKNIKVSWDAADIEALDLAKSYVIAIQLSSDESSHVSEVKNYVIVHPIPPVPIVSMERGIAPAIGLRADRQTDNREIKVDMNMASKKTVTVNFAVDNSLIDLYNTINGTHYAAVPDGFISLPDSSVEIPAGETSVSFPYQTKSQVFFTGNVMDKYDTNGHLIPIRITSVTNGVLNEDNDVIYIPLTTHTLIGPWTLLEGEEFSVVNDPSDNPVNDKEYYSQFGADKLFDGQTTELAGHSWASYLFTQNTYPMTFVADMGEAKVFTKFKIQDTSYNKNSMRNFEMYTAETYDEASTVWTLVAKEKSTAEDWDNAILFDISVQKLAAGRYLKVVMVECAASWVQYLPARLMEIYGEGF